MTRHKLMTLVLVAIGTATLSACGSSSKSPSTGNPAAHHTRHGRAGHQRRRATATEAGPARNTRVPSRSATHWCSWRGANFVCISVRPRASARRSPCSTRAAGATTAAPTSWSASSRRTAGPRTAEQLGDLEVVPLRKIEYRGTEFEEMDVDAVLARRPEVGARRRARAHERPGRRATRSAGRTSRSCSTPAST